MKIEAGALAQRPDRPERHVGAAEHVVAREVVGVEHVGEHERVRVGAVRRQEDERARAVELAQVLQALHVGLNRPRAAVQRRHRRAEGVDRRRALDRDELLQVGGQLGQHVVRVAVELGRQRRGVLAHARRGRDLLGDEPRDLVAVADQRALGAVDGERRAPADERGEAARPVRAPGLRLVLRRAARAHGPALPA